MISIRPATLIDIPYITAIYNEAILNTTATFDTEMKTEKERSVWLLNRNDNFPVVVAEKNGFVSGYACLNPWSDQKACDVVAEISVFIHPEAQGQGIGKQLIRTLTDIGQTGSLLSILACITQGNEQSIHLHRLHGFETIGIVRSYGIKFGKVLDVTLMQKQYKR